MLKHVYKHEKKTNIVKVVSCHTNFTFEVDINAYKNTYFSACHKIVGSEKIVNLDLSQDCLRMIRDALFDKSITDDIVTYDYKSRPCWRKGEIYIIPYPTWTKNVYKIQPCDLEYINYPGFILSDNEHRKIEEAYDRYQREIKKSYDLYQRKIDKSYHLYENSQVTGCYDKSSNRKKYRYSKKLISRIKIISDLEKIVPHKFSNNAYMWLLPKYRRNRIATFNFRRALNNFLLFPKINFNNWNYVEKKNIFAYVDSDDYTFSQDFPETNNIDVQIISSDAEYVEYGYTYFTFSQDLHDTIRIAKNCHCDYWNKRCYHSQIIKARSMLDKINNHSLVSEDSFNLFLKNIITLHSYLAKIFKKNIQSHKYFHSINIELHKIIVRYDVDFTKKLIDNSHLDTIFYKKTCSCFADSNDLFGGCGHYIVQKKF